MNQKHIQLAGIVLVGLLTATSSLAQTHVFQRYDISGAASIEDASERVQQALEATGFQVLATYAPGRPDGCSFESRLIVAVHDENQTELLTANAQTAPFFVTSRVIVFKDPSGIQVAAVTPLSIMRTILLDDTVADQLATVRSNRLQTALQSVPGLDNKPVPFGQKRDRGHIGKTMGVMAGGPFDSKIDAIHTTNLSASQAVERLQDSFGTLSGEWGLDVRYVLELPEDHGFVVGVSGAAMESKSFDIVGAGADKARSNYVCAGVAHAASYPIELYLAPVEGGLEVRSVNAMYRMKMYFEDAGKWAFMKNMGMPGSVADEISRRVEFSLSQAAGL